MDRHLEFKKWLKDNKINYQDYNLFVEKKSKVNPDDYETFEEYDKAVREEYLKKRK